MQVREHVDEHLADALVDRRLIYQVGRKLATDDAAVPSFHDVEIDPEHRRVRAQREARGREWKPLPQPPEDPVFSPHVVRARGDRSEGGPSEHVLLVAETKQVGQVGVPATKLSQAERSVRAGEILTQPRFNPVRVKLLVGPDRDDLGVVRRSHDVVTRSRTGRRRPSRHRCTLWSPRSGPRGVCPRSGRGQPSGLRSCRRDDRWKWNRHRR